MATSYVYTISGDFTNASQVESSLLQDMITNDATVSVDPNYINIEGDNVTINFPSSLTGEQKTALDGIITAYTYTAFPNEPKSFTRQTVVSNDPYYPGDYTSISAAFNAGVTSVFVKNGVYVETQDIIIPNGGQLQGELPGKTIVYFIGAYSIKIDGSGGSKETAGTISVTNSTKTVTGVGTTFTNLSAGNFIRLGTNFYDIASIQSDTELTLVDTFFGKSLSGDSYMALPMYTGNVITNLIVTGSLGTAVYIRGMRHGNLKSVAVTKCAKCVEVIDCGDLSIIEVIPTFSGGVGFKAENSVSLSIHTLNVFNSLSHGIEFVNCLNVVSETCASENNNGYGIYVGTGCNYTNITNGVSKNNNNNGIKCHSSALYTTVANTEVTRNNGNGIDIDGTNSNVTCCFSNDNNGVGIICGDQNIIEGNTVMDNLGNGINIPLNSERCVVSDNNIKGNTGVGINILSTGNGINDNSIYESGSHGIYVNNIKNRIGTNCICKSGGKGILFATGANMNAFNGNEIVDNTGNGLEISNGVSKVLVTGNLFHMNGGSDIVNNGTGYVIEHNITD